MSQTPEQILEKARAVLAEYSRSITAMKNIRINAPDYIESKEEYKIILALADAIGGGE